MTIRNLTDGCAYGGPPIFFDLFLIPTLKDRQKGEYLPDEMPSKANEMKQNLARCRKATGATMLTLRDKK